MARKVTSLYLDEDIVKEAREMGFNVSKICENALKDVVAMMKGYRSLGVLPEKKHVEELREELG